MKTPGKAGHSPFYGDKFYTTKSMIDVHDIRMKTNHGKWLINHQVKHILSILSDFSPASIHESFFFRNCILRTDLFFSLG